MFMRLEILLTWLILHQTILEKYESKRYFGYLQIVNSPKYCQILSNLMLIGQDQDTFDQILFVDSEFYEDHLAKIKDGALKCHFLLYNFMLTVVSDPNKRAMSPFYQTSHVFCERLVLGLINSLNQRLSREPFIQAKSPFNE
jgi:hypothetical protein